MKLQYRDLKLLLLDILSPIRNVDQSTLDQLSPDDWLRLMSIASKHRVTPLLSWRLNHERKSLKFPEEFSNYCNQELKISAFRTLAIKRETLLLCNLLHRGGFPHIFLKGAYLAYFAYPQLGLRPMGDLDILILPSELISAFNYLLDNGAERLVDYMSHPENAAQHSHQLPPINSPSKLLCIELHNKLFHLDGRLPGELDLSQDREFWSRCIKKNLAGEQVPFMSATDLLVHLIEHSVYGHRLSNGPLILSDISYLLHTHEINWSLFWKTIHNAGYIKGACLMLKLVELYYDETNVVWPSSMIPFDHVDENVLIAAALLLLQDLEHSGDVGFMSSVNRQIGNYAKFTFIMSRLFPSPELLSLNYPVQINSSSIYLYYPHHWWRLLITRLPSIIRSSLQLSAQQDMQSMSILNKWLRS